MPRRTHTTTAEARDTGADLTVFPNAKHVVSIRDDIVQLAYNMVTSDGFADQIDQWIHEDDKPGGAPVRVPTVAALCGILIAAYVYRTTLDDKIADILFKEISPKMRQLIGIKERAHYSNTDSALYQVTNRALNRIIDVMDSCVEVRNVKLLKSEHKTRPTFRELRDEQITVIVSRRNWIVHELLGKTFAMLPREVRRQYKGSLAVDGTFLKQFTQPPGRGEWAADPECDWYMRNSDAGEIRKKGFGMEATLAVMTDDEPNTRTPFPKLCLGMVLDQPGYRIGENGAVVITEVVARTGVVHYVAGDRAYNNSIADKFQIPVASIRVADPKQYAKFVFDYRDDQLGVQGSIDGALFIEGQLYCPSIPARLINATIDFRKGTINERDYAKRIAERAKYLFKRKAAGRVNCPATGLSPTARCTLPKKQPLNISNKVDEKRVPIKLLAVIRDNPPSCCEKATFTAHLEGVYAKHGQHLQYGSAEHRAQYALMRSTNEGFNGAAKVGGLQDPTARRKRGLAAQTLACLAMLIAVNVRRINKFLDNATRDRDGVLRVTKAAYDANKAWNAAWSTDDVEDDDPTPPNP